MSQSQKNHQDFNETFASQEYFVDLYGAKDELGNPSQTKIDILRDKLLVKMFQKYGSVDLINASVIDIGCGY
ncbi:MAG: hypothetical protein NWP59_03045, partial [Candidatus Nanopelagicales bacterium]|nr:hypothetical protein [Candidatus Nanopelagicales bacterium]